MAGPDYGVLGATFKICRVLQAVSLIAAIGMTANFVAEIVSAKTSPPAVLVGTLSVVSLLSPLQHSLRSSRDLARHVFLSYIAPSPSFSSWMAFSLFCPRL